MNTCQIVAATADLTLFAHARCTTRNTNAYLMIRVRKRMATIDRRATRYKWEVAHLRFGLRRLRIVSIQDALPRTEKKLAPKNRHQFGEISDESATKARQYNVFVDVVKRRRYDCVIMSFITYLSLRRPVYRCISVNLILCTHLRVSNRGGSRNCERVGSGPSLSLPFLSPSPSTFPFPSHPYC